MNREDLRRGSSWSKSMGPRTNHGETHCSPKQAQ